MFNDWGEKLNKKMAKQFKVGDIVTWGMRFWAHKVIEVGANYLVIDATSAGFPRQILYFEHTPGLQHADFPPDVQQRSR